jgi:hypothetical protein
MFLELTILLKLSLVKIETKLDLEHLQGIRVHQEESERFHEGHGPAHEELCKGLVPAHVDEKLHKRLVPAHDDKELCKGIGPAHNDEGLCKGLVPAHDHEGLHEGFLPAHNDGRN